MLPGTPQSNRPELRRMSLTKRATACAWQRLSLLAAPISSLGDLAKVVLADLNSQFPNARAPAPPMRALISLRGEDRARSAQALFVLCDRFSQYVTGTTVAVDGGLSLYNWIPLRTLS